jgi:hypothetical protein
MPRRFLGFYLMIVVLTIGWTSPVACAQILYQPTSAQKASLKTFLEDHLREVAKGEDKATEYFPAFVHLRDNESQEVIVYVTGGGWCGSGGCNTLVLAPEGSSFRVVTRILITRPPIRVLATKSHGWHDIAVRVQGGGIVRAYEAKLSFDGKTYPSNPTVPPARRLASRVPGKVVVPLSALTERGKPLYP